MRVRTTLVLITVVTLLAAACGGSSGSWSDEILSASEKIANGDPEKPFGTVTDEASAKEQVTNYCNTVNQPDYASVRDFVGLTPLELRADLMALEVSNDTIKELYQGMDKGMDTECSDAKKQIFTDFPYDGWVDSMKCDIDEEFDMTDTRATIVEAACNG